MNKIFLTWLPDARAVTGLFDYSEWVLVKSSPLKTAPVNSISSIFINSSMKKNRVKFDPAEYLV